MGGQFRVNLLPEGRVDGEVDLVDHLEVEAEVRGKVTGDDDVVVERSKRKSRLKNSRGEAISFSFDLMDTRLRRRDRDAHSRAIPRQMDHNSPQRPLADHPPRRPLKIRQHVQRRAIVPLPQQADHHALDDPLCRLDLHRAELGVEVDDAVEVIKHGVAEGAAFGEMDLV
jgi:hypothetical protein